jgi:hypothetical protein
MEIGLNTFWVLITSLWLLRSICGSVQFPGRIQSFRSSKGNARTPTEKEHRDKQEKYYEFARYLREINLLCSLLRSVK